MVGRRLIRPSIGRGVVELPAGLAGIGAAGHCVYRWGGRRKARLLARGSAQQAPSTGLETPASALNSPATEVSTELGWRGLELARDHWVFDIPRR